MGDSGRVEAGWSWARSELRRRLRSNLALVLLIALSGAVVLTAAAGARRSASAFDRFAEASDVADVQVQYGTEDDVDDDVLGALRAHPDVDEAVPLYFTFGFSEASEYELLIISGPDPALFRDIDRPRLLDGRRPDPGAAGEVMLNPFLSDDLGVGVGDRVSVATFSGDTDLSDPSAEPVPGPTAEVEVVGIGTLPYDAADDSFSFMLATPAFYERYATEAAGFGPSFDVLVRDGTDASAIAEEVTSAFTFDELFLSPLEDLAATVEDGTRALVIGLWVFAGVAALAFVVACSQAVRRRLEATEEDQPALRAMGLGVSQRTAAIAMTVVPAVLAGSALAALVAIPASATMPIGAPGRAEPDPGIRLDVLALLGGSAALAVLVLLATMWSAGRVARQRSTTSGRGSALVARATLAQALRGQLRPAEHLGVTMALDPGSQRGRVPVRSAFLGAVLGAAGLAGVLTFGAGLDALVDDPARSGWNWTLRIDPEEPELEAIADLDAVESLGRLVQRQVVVEGEPVSGNAVSSLKGNPSFTVVRGRLPTADEEVALGPELLDRLEVGLGDRVAMSSPDGEVVRMVVVGEALFPTFDEDSAFNDGVAITATAMEELAHSDGDETFVVSFADRVSEGEAAERITSAAPEAVSIYSYPSIPTDVANLDDVRPLPKALAAFLAVLALAAVGHAVATSVQRRRRELGTVRSLGFASGDVRRAVTAQSATLVAGGLLLGLPLGVVMGRTVWRAVAEGLGVVSSPTVPLGLLAAVVPAAILAGVGVAWLPARAARRGVAMDALRAE